MRAPAPSGADHHFEMPVVLFAGRFSATPAKDKQQPAAGDSDVFADKEFDLVWNQEFRQRIIALPSELGPKDAMITLPEPDSLQAASYWDKVANIRSKLSKHDNIAPIPLPFNVALFNLSASDGKHRDKVESSIRRNRRQALFDFLKVFSPIACICALPARTAMDFLSILDPIPLPTFLTLASNASANEHSQSTQPDRTHVVRLMPSNKGQAQAIRERIRATIDESGKSRPVIIVRTNLGDLYSRDLAAELTKALTDAGIAPSNVAEPKLITIVDPIVISVGYRSTLDSVLSSWKQDWQIIQTDGCSIEDVRQAVSEINIDTNLKGKILLAQPTLDRCLLARYAYIAIAQCYKRVREYPPTTLKDRLAGFRLGVIQRLQDLDDQFRFLEGENVGAWFSFEVVTVE